MAGVSPAAVTKACKNALAPACSGKRIDLDHPAAAEYLKGRAPAPTAKKVVSGTAAANLTKKTDRTKPGGDDPLQAVPEDIREFADWSLRDLAERFGTDTAFVDWLKATKSLEDIQEKRIKNAVAEGALVSRELIKNGVLDPINEAHKKMLTDGAKTIALRASTMSEAGEPLIEIEKLVKDQLGSFLRPMKARINRSMMHA